MRKIRIIHNIAKGYALTYFYFYWWRVFLHLNDYINRLLQNIWHKLATCLMLFLTYMWLMKSVWHNILSKANKLKIIIRNHVDIALKNNICSRNICSIIVKHSFLLCNHSENLGNSNYKTLFLTNESLIWLEPLGRLSFLVSI